MRYDVRLKIKYLVKDSQASGRTILRLEPMALPGLQKVTAASVTIDPPPDEIHYGHDFFGNPTVHANHHAAWSRLVMTMQARVERDIPPVADLPGITLGEMAAALADTHSLVPDSPHHFTHPSARATPVPAIVDYAHGLLAAHMPAREAIMTLMRALHADMKFDADATTVNTPAADAFAKRRGVCQDFSHIMIVALRAMGVPAGYVSGYLRTIPPPGKARLEGADAMHAWVRAWCGPNAGWIEVDPTNNTLARDDHIAAGYGRDYLDVSPVRGMLRTAGAQKTKQEVDVVPID